MEIDRRQLAAGLALAGLAAPAAAAPMLDAPLVHHVFFWLKRPGSAEDRARLIAGLRTLTGIPVLRSLHVGLPAPTEARDVVDASWDVSEIMIFASAADQKAYQDHPLHRAFVARCEPLWRKVVVYDTIAA